METNTVDELTKIEHKLAAAWVAQDPAFHAKTLADDWCVTDPAGRVLTKAQVLSESFSRTSEILTREVDDIKVRDFGDWAIVTGRTTGAIRQDGSDLEFKLRFTDVFRRENGEWRCIASQWTFIHE